MRENGGDYRITFALALKAIYAAVKKGVKNLYDFVCSTLQKQRDRKEAEQGIKIMHYSEYKNNYSACKTVSGSYDKKTKTIKVYVGASNVDDLCPHCHTWCYGDCQA